jgi:hypothetical protein
VLLDDPEAVVALGGAFIFAGRGRGVVPFVLRGVLGGGALGGASILAPLQGDLLEELVLGANL